MKGINENKRPMITEEEKRVYDRIMDKYQILSKERKEYTNIFCAKFKNGTELINDFKNNKIILDNNGEQLDINSLLPEGVKILFNQKEDLQYVYQDKTIISMAILDEIDFFILLHEIGHAWDCIKNQELYKDNSNEMRIIKERNSWAWALKKIKQLKKDKFISNKIADREFVVNAKASLYTYAMWLGYVNEKQYAKLLNRKLEEKDLRIFEHNFIYPVVEKPDSDSDKEYDL